jgi:predicted CoA-binding protein
MATMKEMVSDFLAQKRIAVVGVSRDGASPANGIYKKLKAEGHTVYAINPNAQTLEGDPAYPDVKSTPDKLDGVVIVTTPDVTETVVHQCVEANVPRIWIHNSFTHGSSLSESAVSFAREHNVKVIAAGCPMMYGEKADIFHKGMCWFMRVTGKIPA